jgi:hypothetical protein
MTNTGSFVWSVSDEENKFLNIFYRPSASNKRGRTGVTEEENYVITECKFK